jgi:uncharacterized caspase-like protein
MNASDAMQSARGFTLWLRWSLLILLAPCIVGAPCLAEAEPPSTFVNSPCFAQSRDSATESCERLAREVSHDIHMARALGDELERAGRYPEAVNAYRIALTIHPNHRDLLQGLIRARGLTRSAELLAPATSKASAQAAATPATPPKPAPVPAPPTAKPQPQAELPVQPQPHTKERYIALIIGNQAYRNFTPLRSPLADAQAMASILGRDYGFIVHTLQNATRYEMLSALSRLRREATENDHVLIYYAGHGYLDDATSRGYWLPVDAERDNIANWISTNDITDVLAGLQARHALVLADSCFSGSLLRSDPTVEIDERQSLLRKLAMRRSRSIMTSGGLEPVIDDGAGKHSVFAAALLRALSANRQPLEAGRLFVQIRDRVALNAAQTPQYAPLRNAGHDGGDFIFEPRKR